MISELKPDQALKAQARGQTYMCKGGCRVALWELERGSIQWHPLLSVFSPGIHDVTRLCSGRNTARTSNQTSYGLSTCGWCLCWLSAARMTPFNVTRNPFHGDLLPPGSMSCLPCRYLFVRRISPLPLPSWRTAVRTLPTGAVGQTLNDMPPPER